jgi:hypothetical protein
MSQIFKAALHRNFCTTPHHLALLIKNHKESNASISIQIKNHKELHSKEE